MQARAKLTSKGQITIPVEVRRELGLSAGDSLVFEVAGRYATIHKKRPTLEVLAELREMYPPPVSRDITDRQAVEEYFDEEFELRMGPTLYVSNGDGTFKTYGERDPGFDNEDR